MNQQHGTREESAPSEPEPRRRRRATLAETWAAVSAERPSGNDPVAQAIGAQVATMAAATAGMSRAVLDLSSLTGPVINPSLLLGSGLADRLLEQNRNVPQICVCPDVTGELCAQFLRTRL